MVTYTCNIDQTWVSVLTIAHFKEELSRAESRTAWIYVYRHNTESEVCPRDPLVKREW